MNIEYEKALPARSNSEFGTMNHPLKLFGLGLLTILLAATPQARGQNISFETLSNRFDQQIRPILSRHCLSCHSTEKMEGDLDLEHFKNLTEVRKLPETWRHAREQISSGEMPPKNRKRPTSEEIASLTGWISDYLRAEALANAGDPGPVLVRRLTNVEYDNTIRDLTGIDLKPTREFPADGAAGEGFSNVGEALVMSPALLEKYMAAAREVASHLVLTPTGTRFSKAATPADWTNELLDEIRAFYKLRTDPEGHTRVNLQGLQWDTNSGGRIPLASYLHATILLRESGNVSDTAIEQLAAREKLSPKFLKSLWLTLNAKSATPLLASIQTRWRKTDLNAIGPLALEIQNWQRALTKFGSVGHFKKWLGTNDPLVTSHTIREALKPAAGSDKLKLELGSILVSENAIDAGTIVWDNPRLEKPGQPAILLNQLDAVQKNNNAIRNELKQPEKYLAALDEIQLQGGKSDFITLARDKGLQAELLQAWSVATGIGHSPAPLSLNLMTEKQENIGGYSFVKGWGKPETPNVAANSSDQMVRIPGILKGHSIAVHPSPSQSVAIVWTSPVAGTFDIESVVNDAHGDCGNGVTWSLEMRRGRVRQVLAAGVADTSKPNVIAPQKDVRLEKGAVVALVIGPRDREHSCDLTEVNLILTEKTSTKKAWSLVGDVSPSLHAGNPHADSHGNAGVWAFTLEPVASTQMNEMAVIPRGSILDKWLAETNRDNRRKIASEIQLLFSGSQKPAASSPDSELLHRMNSLQGPIFSVIEFSRVKPGDSNSINQIELKFGEKRTIEIPAEIAEGRTFVSDVRPGPDFPLLSGFQPRISQSGNLAFAFAFDQPLVIAGDQAKTTWIKAFDDFRSLFPGALCYPQIVPVDEVVTLALFHREDENLARLMLSENEIAYLNRLWDELWFVSQEPLKVEVGYKQFMEYVTQDGDVRIFEPLRLPIRERAAKFRAELATAEPLQYQSVLKLIDKAWRRPLRNEDRTTLDNLYKKLRTQAVPHAEALRLVLVRGLVAPAFLYRLEPGNEAAKSRPLDNWELASRLSYFLWSSLPDETLRSHADAGRLSDPKVLSAEVSRMLADPKARALATEFAAQWLHLKDFNTLNEKSEKIFPEFADLKGDMYEEVVQFFTDFFRRNRPISEILTSDRTFLNENLARFYETAGISGTAFVPVDGMKQNGRGGLLGFAALTARQAGASRTSPILRGNWLLETLLGEKQPKPPKNVPQLPESELDTNGLTMRQITEKHRADPACSKCHDRIDPFGMALEAFDPIGRLRKADLGGRPIDTSVTLPDGTKFSGLSGLRDYLVSRRQVDFQRQFDRKLLGYALGRAVIVSDDPLLEELSRLAAKPGTGIHDTIQKIVASPQFRNQRGISAEVTSN